MFCMRQSDNEMLTYKILSPVNREPMILNLSRLGSHVVFTREEPGQKLDSGKFSVALRLDFFTTESYGKQDNVASGFSTGRRLQTNKQNLNCKEK